MPEEPVVAARRLLAPVVVTERPERGAADRARATVESLPVEERQVVLRGVHDERPRSPGP